MTLRKRAIGATEDKSQKIGHAQFTDERKTFKCNVCKCQCEIKTNIHVKGVSPQWCPFENDKTNLRYSKWIGD